MSQMNLTKDQSCRQIIYYRSEITIMTKLTTQEYIDFLQRFIIVHSYIYYELNNNVISDKEYDAKSKELVKYKNEYPDLWKNSMYYEQFGDDYNGATGFTLYHSLNDRQKKIILSIVTMGGTHMNRRKEE